jgi:NADPH-dependent glutamate synthase beta subunit-like oxidoreductase
LIRREIAVIEALGVEIRCGARIGGGSGVPSFADLRRDYAAVLVAVGAKRPRLLGLPGEAGPRVFGGVDLLRAVALGEPLDVGHEIVVIGGGNVAYDVARTVLRQAAFDTARAAARLPGTRRVRLVSLETLEEMPADTVEIREGDEEGIERHNGWGPVEVLRDAGGAVEGVALRRCRRVYDAARRFAPVFDDAERIRIDCDTVLFAAGQMPDLSFLHDGGTDIEEARPGWPRVDATTLSTTAPGVFVAGDLAHGTRLLIDAVASGKLAARSIYRYVTGREIRAESLDAHIPLDRYRREPGFESIRRVGVPVRAPAERLESPASSVELGYDARLAVREASRCLDCGVTPVFDGTRCVLCGGCVDVCPTSCLKLVSLAQLDLDPAAAAAIAGALGEGADLDANSAILKDEDRCIRCALCEMRCPVAAITMERVAFDTRWVSAPTSGAGARGAAA